MAKIVKLILTKDRRGTGKDKDPIRLVAQLWTLGGHLVLERDDHTGETHLDTSELSLIPNQ